MSTPVVVVVEPETPGNVGTIARAMKNFGLSELKLVDPPELDPDGPAYGYAGQARDDVLPDHEVVTLDDVLERYHTVGCTAVTNEDETKHVRYPFKTPRELADDLAAVETDTALIFGREQNGLRNDELARMDEVCSIPASADYPVLNLGQAATITLYELRDRTVEESQHPDDVHVRASQQEIEGLNGQFDEFVEALGHPDEKQAKVGRLWRRVLGRAHPTGREVATLRGIFRRAERKIRE